MSLLCSLPLISSLVTSCLPPLPLATGYVEGEYVRLTSLETAQIQDITVRRGERISPGQALVHLETRDAKIAVAQARAALAQAKSRLEDISQGRRPEEIAVIEANLRSAKAEAVAARREQKRQADLLRRGATPKAKYDQAVTQSEVAAARVAELEANLAVARLPARPGAIAAAKAGVDQAFAVLENAEWRLSQRTVTAGQSGEVVDVIRNPGEIAGPQAPVLLVLPDGAVKLRLYLPEDAFSKVHVGTRLAISCDGCSPDQTATISYISTGPEFTPPVIYSLQNRQKLVYMIEARPGPTGAGLKPGQIVNVDLLGGP